jgi:hypothetical protein
MNLRDPLTMIGGRVEDDGNTLVRAITETGLEHESQQHERAYTWTSIPYDGAAQDTIICVRNDSKTLILHPQWIVINNGATASEYQIYIVTAAFTIAGTVITPLNMNTKGAVNPDISAYADETGNTAQGRMWERTYMPVDSRRFFDLRGLDLNQDHAIGVDMVADGGGEQSITICAHHGPVH